MSTKLLFTLALAALPASLWAQERPALPRGHVFFANDFEGSDALKGWSGPGVLGDGFQGGHALVLERPAEQGSGYATATIQLPVEKMRGYVVQFSARIKAENVSRKPQPFNGVKFMAPIVTDEGKTWPAAEMGVGTFDWQKVAFRAIVPEDAKSISLVVGMEAVTGKAWFDDIRIVAWKPLSVQGPPATAGKMYKGHDLPRLRGAMASPDIDEEGLRVLGQQWNANLVRWQLVRREKFDDPLDLAAYERWLQSALKQLDAALPLCEKYGLRVVVDLHSPPGGHRLSGGYAGSDHGLFTDAACQKKFVEVWQHMARRYKDSKAIWGYDLANEPVEAVAGEDLADWQELAEQAAKAIRAIDPERTIIVEPPEWGSPQGLRELRPLEIPNIVYSVHMYLPHAFTHQGVHQSGKAFRYPGEIDGKRWAKAQLEAALKPVVEFQRRYNVHIYIGEFSAIRWAPDQSAHHYLKDLIDIFETHGWDWSYHAFREWDGWSVEHGSDPKDHGRSKTPTDREQLLRSWFAKNKAATGEAKTSLSPPVYLPDGTEFRTWEVPPHFARTYHVAQTHPRASDDNPGTEDLPLKTIGRAAQLLQPGERVVVRAGIYRERVRPARGGTGPDRMISYEASPGEMVVLSGSEILRAAWAPSQQKEKPGGPKLWMTKLPEDLFPGENPFAQLNLTDQQIDRGMPWAVGTKGKVPNTLRRGLVFQNGQRLRQVADSGDLAAVAGAYWVEEDGLTLHLHPLAEADPNRTKIEITTREMIFAPETFGLGYLRVKGFAVEHSGNGFPRPQHGALSTMRGHHWIIEGNTVQQCNAIGIDIGDQFDTSGPKLAQGGQHIVRRNTVSDCGIGGIEGKSIEHTLIEENHIFRCGWQRTEKIWETGGIKVHCTLSCLLRTNEIHDTLDAPGIWMDYENRNSRCTQNVIYNIHSVHGGIFMEASQAPNLVDRNVVWGYNRNGIYQHDCDELLILHNLIGQSADAGIRMQICTGRKVGGRLTTAKRNKIQGNILVDNGQPMAISDPENSIDWNLFGAGAGRKPFDLGAWCGKHGWDAHSTVARIEAAFHADTLALRLSVSGDVPRCPRHPALSFDFFGRAYFGDSTVPPGPLAVVPSGPETIFLGLGGKKGFAPLFNGQNLDGWSVRQANNHDWSVVDGVIDCDPHGPATGDQNLWTKKEYGDFELLVDWRIKEAPYVNRSARIILPDGTYKKDATDKEIAITAPNTDSGIFLRGQHKSQVNIWCWPVGSGEVWGYRTDPKFSAEVHAATTPKVKADRPIGQWNTFHIVLKGDRLTVKLNGKLVIDNAQLPGVPAKGPIALQHHADRKDGEWGASLVQFRNIYLKELE